MIFLFALLGKDPWMEASMEDPEYAAFQAGDLHTLIKIDPAWIRAAKDFRLIRRLLTHNPEHRIVPPCYTHTESDLSSF
uniref:Protein kinase domain-containing protein n=1 Tax=Steinernema glaseri TaxID=37863 RepID=A0A1I7ZP99_9BILA